MSFADFKKTAKGIIDKHFVEVGKLVASRKYRPTEGETFLFPSTLLFTQTETHYALELIGAMRKQQLLHVKEQRVASLNQVVNNFATDEETFYIFNTEDNQPTNVLAMYSSLNLTCEYPDDKLEHRFPGVRATFESTGSFIGMSDRASHLPLNAEKFRSLMIDNCMLAGRSGSVVRPKFVNLFYACSVDTDSAEVASDLAHISPVHNERVTGVQIASPEHSEAMKAAAGFATLYLQGARETTVTAFIEKHSDIIEKVFDADKVYYQVELPWEEGNPDPAEVSIQPDVLLRTKSGEWKIVEFKLPLLDKKSLTASDHARRRLTLSVGDGVAQLGNYEEYFTFPQNLAAAQKVLQDTPAVPSLVLVIGSDENYNAQEIREATRMSRPFDLIDYDTLMRLYLAAAT
ncbi:hypothetical protein ACIRP3_43780 [Streptomyces sp. NPDC101209]|uniref:hypothetical protein n=1 Tax=Streptomyces sp. NPDC101209 TaxID=3366129 RepID=UPI00382840AC